MIKTKPIPVRLTDAMLARLDAAASATGLTNRTAVIKLCLLLFLDSLEKNGYRLPGSNMPDLIRDLDGRSHRYDAHNSELRKVAERPTEQYGSKKGRKKK